MSDEVQVTPELLARLERFARCAVPDARWSFKENRDATRVFGSRWAFEVGRQAPLGMGLLLTPSQSIAEYVVAADPPTVLALVKRIRELESGMVLDLSDIPVGCHVTLTQGVSFWTVSLSSGVECRTVYRNGTSPNEAYTAALKAWREDG